MKRGTHHIAVEECEMNIIGHKVFVRLKDIPMYLSKRTKDSIRNRYSHSVEVGLSTEYILNHLSGTLGDAVDLNFFKIGKIVGLLHDIGHTAFSHDGEHILDAMLQKASVDFSTPIRFNANLNNFRRIVKYGFYDQLPEDVKRYALASLVKRSGELKEYPEFLYLREYISEAIEMEERYLVSKGIEIQNTTGKTILCQAMDLADENRYRVTDIIDALNIYSVEKMQEILRRMLQSKVRLKQVRKLVHIPVVPLEGFDQSHSDKIEIKALLIGLLERSSNAKTEFQNMMNSVSMAFNRNLTLREDGKIMPVDEEIEALRRDFYTIAAKYLWGSKKVQNIKQPFRHYFTAVAEHILREEFDLELIDSNTYQQKLLKLKDEMKTFEAYQSARLSLLRNFLGGLTNHKIMELYKKITLLKMEARLGYPLKNRDKLIHNNSVEAFEKKLHKKMQRLLQKKGSR